MKTYTLKELRNKKQETQQKTANAIHIDRSLYSHYENGIRMPRIDVAKKIAAHFGVKVDQIKFINKNDK
jgi:putative transcriptional regulator